MIDAPDKQIRNATAINSKRARTNCNVDDKSDKAEISIQINSLESIKYTSHSTDEPKTVSPSNKKKIGGHEKHRGQPVILRFYAEVENRRIAGLTLNLSLFVTQGKNDPGVPYTEAEQIVGALRKRGAVFEYKFYDEGDGVSKLKTRLELYPLVADFLDK